MVQRGTGGFARRSCAARGTRHAFVCSVVGGPARTGEKLGCAVALLGEEGVRHSQRPSRLRLEPSLRITLFAEGLVGLQEPKCKPAGVACDGDTGLDGAHPTSPVLGVAFSEDRASTRQAMPLHASRCSAKPWREIWPRRVMLANCYIAGTNPVAEYRCSASETGRSAGCAQRTRPPGWTRTPGRLDAVG